MPSRQCGARVRAFSTNPPLGLPPPKGAGPLLLLRRAEERLQKKARGVPRTPFQRARYAVAAFSHSAYWATSESSSTCHRSQVCGLVPPAQAHRDSLISTPSTFQVSVSPRSVNSTRQSPPLQAWPQSRRAIRPVLASDRVSGPFAFPAGQSLPGALLVLAPGIAPTGAGWPSLGSSRFPRCDQIGTPRIGPAVRLIMGLRGKVCFLAQTGCLNSIVASLPSRNAPAARDSSLTGPFRPRWGMPPCMNRACAATPRVP